MEYISTIILSIVQAITEFLPISSSGHLIIVHQLIESELLNNLTFDVILHAGTLLAVVIYFWKDIINIVKGFFQSLFKWNLNQDFNQQLAWLIIIGTIPAAVVGFFFTDLIEQIFRSVYIVIIMLVVGGILFIIFEKIGQRRRNLESMTFIDALVIGLAQVLAFIPGTSRSGITIVAGLGKQFDRVSAARFSFLLSVPVIIGANIRKVTQLSSDDFSGVFVFVSILGVALTTLIGFFTIKLLLRFLQNHSLTIFAIYRFILALVLFLIFVL